MGLMSHSAYRLLRSPADKPIPNTSTDTGQAINRKKDKIRGEEGKIDPISPVLDEELEAALGEVGQAGISVAALTTRLSDLRSRLQSQQLNPPSHPARRRIHQKHPSVPSR